MPFEFYKGICFVRPGLVRLAHPIYGEQHWKLGKIRGDTRVCALCNESLVAPSAAWRPMTHAGNRSERLCEGCMDQLL